MSQAAQPPKNPGVAAVLGFFFPGIGQIYNGQFLKGIAFLGIDAANALLMLVWIGFLTAPLFALFSAWDAYRSAEAHNRRLAEQAGPKGANGAVQNP